MKNYIVTGMSCAACSARVERAVSSLEGVNYCTVNLLTGRMTVDGADDESIISAVVKAGYGASTEEDKRVGKKEERFVIREHKDMLLRLFSSVLLLLPLMYASMGHVMWGWPLPKIIAESPMAIALIELLLCGSILIINRQFFINGYKGAINRAPNMDTLVAMGSGVSYLWSIYVTVKIFSFGTGADAHHHLHDLYFESAAMILALITLGKFLEALAKGRTTDAIKKLMSLTPDTATVIRDGVQVVIPTDMVRVHDRFVLRAGDRVPVDGVVREGFIICDESALTGESMPCEKEEGCEVYAASVNLSGYAVLEAKRVGEDTAMSRVVKMVSDAASTKAPVAKAADRVAGFFVPIVLIIALVSFALWMIFDGDIGYALERGISVLVISCPCALGLATPVAIMVGSGIGATGGVLFKNATALEVLGKIKNIALDKTGTITKGEARVVEVIPIASSEDELISLAYSLEFRSEHPLARAICDYAESKGYSSSEVSDFSATVGSGVSARTVDGELLYGGNYRSVKQRMSLAAEWQAHYDRLTKEGKTPLFFTKGESLMGIIAVSDTIKEDSTAAISSLRKMGIKTVMLTGDNEQTAMAIGEIAGVDEVIAGVMPDEKESVVRELSKRGGVIMVGDGINDAPALMSADVGVAIGRGADVAIDSADVVLMHSSLTDLVCAVRLSRRTLKIIYENLFWAFIYNIVGIPIAAGAFIPIFGLELDPMFGAMAMSLSSFFVVMNALRLNLIPIFKNENNKENEKMQMIITVKGMMCPHCEARVRSVLEGLECVDTAEVSHKDGTARVLLKCEVEEALVTSAITGAGYEVISVEKK